MQLKWLRRLKLIDAPAVTKDETSNYTLLTPDGKALRLNGIIGENDVMDAHTLPKILMPNRVGFMSFSPGK
jgi:hypothetical protein